VQALVLSELTLDEQIQALEGASVIVAEEGQALNLIPFLRAKTLIMIDKGVVTERSKWSQNFERMAILAGWDVRCFFNGLDYQKMLWEFPLEKFTREIEAWHQEG